MRRAISLHVRDPLGAAPHRLGPEAPHRQAVTTTYLWCSGKPCQARNASNTVIKGYYAEGEFIPGSPGASLYYALDRTGSARQTTAPATDYLYAGTFYNADSGLYLTPHRAYDPVSGRWLSRDPIGEAGDPMGNLYAYVGGDPVGLADPAGLGPDPCELGAAEALEGIGGLELAAIGESVSQPEGLFGAAVEAVDEALATAGEGEGAASGIGSLAGGEGAGEGTAAVASEEGSNGLGAAVAAAEPAEGAGAAVSEGTPLYRVFW